MELPAYSEKRKTHGNCNERLVIVLFRFALVVGWPSITNGSSLAISPDDFLMGRYHIEAPSPGFAALIGITALSNT